MYVPQPDLPKLTEVSAPPKRGKGQTSPVYLTDGSLGEKISLTLQTTRIILLVYLNHLEILTANRHRSGF